MGGRLNLDWGTLNFDGGTLTLDRGTRPPRPLYNLGTDHHDTLTLTERLALAWLSNAGKDCVNSYIGMLATEKGGKLRYQKLSLNCVLK